MFWRSLLIAGVLAYNPVHARDNVTCRGTFSESRTPASVTTYEKLELTPEQRQGLRERYGVDPKDVLVAPKTRVPVIFRMSGHETLVPRLPPGVKPVRDIKRPQVTIVGGGPAGLTAALYLAEAGISVVIVERNERLGGLGMGTELKGIRAGGGAAYSAGPEGGLEYEIFRKIGLGKYKQKISITEPIDSYLWKGKLYQGIWEEHTLKQLPKSFLLFKHALLKLSKLGAGQESGVYAEWADGMDMATLVRRMPVLLAEWKDKDSTEILESFKRDKRLNKSDPMRDVIDLLDLYGRSALGGPANLISARQFVDFYESEIYTRFTGTLGTGTVAEHLINKLKEYGDLIDFRTSSPVFSVENTSSGVVTIYAKGQEAHELHSDKVIFAAPISLAPRVVKDLKGQDPEKAKAISEIQMTDYAVHVARLRGHPYRSTYDTWVFNERNHQLPTDYILGRWQDPDIRAYEGTQDFRNDPKDDYGVISIYHPLGESNIKNFSLSQNLGLVDTAIENLFARLQSHVSKNKQRLDVELVESYRWPDSIHVVHPGYLKKIPILARPIGNIHFANNTIAAPELETAMARGAREAKEIIQAIKARPRKKLVNE